ncbi:MAG: AmmeMemoRadiSam system protein B [Halanaerobiales bacterium]
MSIIMGALTPHPPIIIPEIGKGRREEVRKTINSLEELGKEIKEKKPDILITISPHGPVFTDAISILDQEKLEGDFSDFACPEVGMSVKTDQEFIQKIKENAQEKHIEVITLSTADLEKYNYPGKLDHGVMVPLYFIKEQTELSIPVIPITMGLLEYEKLYSFGQVIHQTVEEMDLKAVIVASGDLSHRLKPGAPAGFNPLGEEFDKKLIQLLDEERYEEVLGIDTHLIEKAGECGLRPVIIMLGALAGRKFESDVKSYEGPFGVGYGVVSFYQSS